MMELDRSNTTLLSKNKEILELKSTNFELDKLSRNNVELKSAEFQITKLTEMLNSKTTELATYKSNSQAL